MRDKDITDAIEAFAPSEEQKERIYGKIASGQPGRKAGRRWIAWACAAAACVVIAVAAAILLPGAGEPDKAALVKSGGAQTDQPSPNGGVLSATESSAVFAGFVFTTYRPTGGAEYLSANFEEEAERLMLTPDIKTTLANYSPAMSCVPGIPFTIDMPDGLSVDTIRVSADGGGLCEWDQDTGIVTAKGNSAAIAAGGTIYWSPVGSEDAVDISDFTLMVEAVADNGVVVGIQNIYITQDEEGYYYAATGEPETM